MFSVIFSTLVSIKLVHSILSTSGKPWVIHPSGQQPVYFNYNSVGDNTRVYSSVANDWERNYTYDWGCLQAGSGS